MNDPDTYDGTQLLIRVQLPPRQLTVSELLPHVYGLHLNDGAKPWPYYFDATDGRWWSLSTPTSTVVGGLAWMIELKQLRYRPRRDAEDFLDRVYYDLEQAAARFGATIQPECSPTEALVKLDRVVKFLTTRDYEVKLIVRAPEGTAYPVSQWWRACEQAGLEYGDGNLFWMLETKPGKRRPIELFCVEPYSIPGYFHRRDLESDKQYPDVRLSFRVRDFRDPRSVLKRMHATATSLAQSLGAQLLMANELPFDLSAVQARLDQAITDLASLGSPSAS